MTIKDNPIDPNALNWRPEDLTANPCPGCTVKKEACEVTCSSLAVYLIEHSTFINVVKYLDQECTEHPRPKRQGDDSPYPTYHGHRYECWRCMAKLKELSNG
jgi:hypothetical protein